MNREIAPANGIFSVIVALKVRPGSRLESLRLENNMIVVHVKAPATDGKANDALVRYLADRLKVAKSQVVIVSGHTSRFKRIEISEVNANKLMLIASTPEK